MFYALHRQRSGYVGSIPEHGNFTVSDSPSGAFRFWTAGAADRFREKHRNALRGGWAIREVSRVPAILRSVGRRLAALVGKIRPA